MFWFSCISADGDFLINVLGPSLLIVSGASSRVVGMTTVALASVAASHTAAVDRTSHAIDLDDTYRVGMLGTTAMSALPLLCAIPMLPRA